MTSKISRKSDNYVNDILARQSARMASTGRSEMTRDEKQAAINKIAADSSSFFHKLGQMMVGPIQLKLRYQGLVRNVLMEDEIDRGVTVDYDILDDLGQAYVLHGSEGEVAVQPFEGKKALIRFVRIAAFPQIKKEDQFVMRVDIAEYAQDESRQAIQKQEDIRLITLLEAAVQDYGTAPGNPFPGAQVINELSGSLTPATLFEAAGMVERRELAATRILMNPVDYYDFHGFDINQAGFAFKDRIIAGEKITNFGPYEIHKSIIVPQGTVYITPDPEFLGVFPLYYSLHVEEFNQPAKFHYGWVMDELVGMAVLNPRGLAKLVKS